MIAKEEKAALIFGGPEAVLRAIEDRKELMNQMVGRLYPSILRDEIIDLQVLHDSMDRPEVQG